MFVIGDVHGCYNTLVALLDKIPPQEEICFVGDLIDRGANSLEVFKLVQGRKFHCVRGNHEQMASDSYAGKNMQSRINQHFWAKTCGGEETLTSFQSTSSVSSEFEEFLKWSRQLPHLLHFEVEGQNLVVSHSLVMPAFGTPLEIESALWYRDSCVHNENDYDYEGAEHSFYNIFGHTPTNCLEDSKVVPYIGSRYACIDTGAVYGGKLTALEFPSMRVVSQEFVG